MNQKLIAEKLNISQATVSMALKGSPRISRALSETIRKLAEDSGYHPNLADSFCVRAGAMSSV